MVANQYILFCLGHTATLWKGDKLLVFGGENEHRSHLSDLIIFDLNTAHWTQPHVSGSIPKGRYRHAAVLHEDKLFIVGGMTGHDSEVLDDIFYLDLKTFTWSRSWRFVARFDHSAYIWFVISAPFWINFSAYCLLTRFPGTIVCLCLVV